MQDTFNIILEVIFTPLILFSSFFESILLKNEKRDSKYKYMFRNIIHIVYCASISIVLGAVLGIVVQGLLISIYPNIEIGFHAILLIQIILLLMLLFILFLNYNDKTFNMPKTIFSVSWFLINIKLKSLFLEMLVYVVVFPSILILLFSVILSDFNINTVVYIAICIFSFSLGVLIFGETTKETIRKLSRQFVMWSSFYLVATVVTIYQINEYILEGKKVGVIVGICGLVIGLVFTLTTITDVLKNLYKEFIKKDRKDKNLLKKNSRFLRNKYNIDKCIQKFYKIKSNIIEDFKYIVQVWKSGDKLRVIKGVSISLTLILCFIMYVIYQDSINTLIPYYMENISLYLFRGNRFLRDRVAILLVILIINIKFILDLYKNFKDLNLVDRIAYISRITILASVFFMILGVTFFSLNKFIYTLLNVLIIVPILVFYITEKFKKFSQVKK